MLLVRERPPLRLDLSVGAGPNAYRWAQDDPSAANKPDALTFSTTMPGGFEQASCTLERDPRLDYHDLTELSTVTIRGLGGSTVAWQGRLEEEPSTAGSQAQIQPQMFGWQNGLSDDNSAAMIYVDQSLTAWQGPSLDRQIALLNASIDVDASQVLTDPASNLPALVTQMSGPWSRAHQAEAWYDAGANQAIGKVYFAWNLQTPGAIGDDAYSDSFWQWDVVLSSDDLASAFDWSGNLQAAGPGSGTVTATASRRYALLQLRYANSGGADGVSYPVFWRPAVYGDHGLTLHGSDPQGVLASDVIAHAVSNWASDIGFTAGSSGTIQPSSFVIPQLAFTPTTVAAIIQAAVQYELLDWAVWEQTAGTTGPTLYVNERGGRGKSWTARVGPAQLQQAGPQASRIWNGVVVSFTDVDGTAKTAGPPGSGCTVTDSSLQDTSSTNAANEAGITKWASLPMGTTTPSGAIQVGARFLEVQALADMAGQASLVGHVQDTSGVWWPAWVVRAGDSISFVDASFPGSRRVVSTSYDDSSKTNTIQLEQPPDDMAALLQRMAVSVSPLGIG